MARKKFKCPRCERRFSMAAHLARHVNAIHKRAKKKAAKGKPKARRAGRPTRTKNGRRRTNPNVAGLLSQVEAHHAELVAQRASLDAQIDATNRAMKALRRA